MTKATAPVLPEVLVVRTPGLDAGAADTEVFCENRTPHPFRVATKSTSFVSVNDEGAILECGPAPVEATLAAGESIRIGDVIAWEWDGPVGLLIAYEDLQTGERYRATYSLKNDEHGVAPVRIGVTSRYVCPPQT